MRLPTTLALLLLANCACAQALRFQHLTTDDGLSDNSITCLHEDANGFLWIGTEHGLDRYDGSRIEHMDIGGSEGATDEWITAIAEQDAEVLWIATRDHGLIQMPLGASWVKRFRKDNTPGSLRFEQLNDVFDLNDTTLLIAAREVTLMFMDKRTLKVTYWSDSTSLDPDRAVPVSRAQRGWCHTIVPLDKERLWLTLLNSQYSFIVDRKDLKVTTSFVLRRKGSQTQTCGLLLNNKLYTGGWQNGIDVVDLETLPGLQRMAPSAPTRLLDIPDEVNSMVPWGDRLLAATRQSGLFLIDPTNGTSERISHLRNDPSSLVSDRVRKLLVGRDGTLWAATASGLDRYDPKVWRMTVHELNDEKDRDASDLLFHRIEALPDGAARIYTSHGFLLVDAAGNAVEHAVRVNDMDLQPTVSGRDHQGMILLGTEYGILRYGDLSKEPIGRLEPIDNPDFTYRVGEMFQVRGIWPDMVEGRAVYVIGTMGFGVQVVDALTNKAIGMGMPASAVQGNSCSLVNSMVRDARGRYWCASVGGLFYWSCGDPLMDAEHFPPTDGTPIIAQDQDVRDLLLAGDTIWALTRSGVLLRVVDDKVVTFTPVPSTRTTMHGLTADHSGLLWITTDDGLLRFDPLTGTFIHVPINDGRTFRKLTRAIATLSNGRIALCADNALVTFDPSGFATLPELPDAYITGVSSAGRALQESNGQAQLSYRASVIDIGVSAKALGFPAKLLFDYKLEGVEPDWRSTTADEPLRYAGLPVGKHRLLVRVRDVFGRASPERTLLTITVTGPVWQQWWFYAIVALLVSALVVAWSRYRLRQALRLQTVRDRIASDLHDEVGSSLSSITIGSQLASRLSGSEEEKVKQIMERIGETSSQSLRSMSDIVWAIDPKNDHGDALVKRMRRVANELLDNKGIEVSFSTSGGVEDLKLPMGVRKELVLICKEALHNASKHSEASLVQVSLHRRNGHLAMSVKDDGKGFDPALHPDGHGLGSMSRRATVLGTSLDLVSAPGLGTLVAVEVDLTRIRD